MTSALLPITSLIMLDLSIPCALYESLALLHLATILLVVRIGLDCPYATTTF